MKNTDDEVLAALELDHPTHTTCNIRYTKSQIHCQRYTRCRQRGCRHCSEQKGKRLAENIEKRLTEQAKHHHIVLTLPTSSGELRQSLRQLRMGLGRLRRRVKWSRHIRGGFYKAEATERGELWHPHLHIFVEGNSELSATDLTDLWRKITGATVVSVNRIDSREYVQSAIRYVTKPPQRHLFIDGRSETLEAFLSATSGLRLHGRFGTFRGPLRGH